MSLDLKAKLQQRLQRADAVKRWLENHLSNLAHGGRDNAEALNMCQTEYLEDALSYAKNQLWLSKRGRQIKRFIEKQLKQRLELL